MLTTELQSRPLSPLSRVVIDCSRFQDFAENGLLDWVRSCPQSGSVHVILPSGRRQPAYRQLLSSLRILGCQVTARL
ncbi:MAG: hypothetical protein PHE68_00730 [Candidatus Peribacteraceae bacterium]|nr:hypothetical protein [Candidatus Peribacteraceae bacterium]MDD5074321.1 hypothetical protein [Candidatus Peribacteraceae bacterium]